MSLLYRAIPRKARKILHPVNLPSPTSLLVPSKPRKRKTARKRTH